MQRALIIIVHLLIAASIFGAVMYAGGPLWVHATSIKAWSRPLGFSQDGKSLFSIENQPHTGATTTFILLESDVETGRVLNRATIKPPPGRRLRYSPSIIPDGMLLSHAPVVSNPPGDPLPEVTDVQFEIINPRTGRSVRGPFSAGRIDNERISPSGQWLWGTVNETNPFTGKLKSSCLILSLSDGRRVVKKNLDRWRYGAVAFSPNESEAAVIEVDVNQVPSISIYRLSSGEKQRTYTLPRTHPWESIVAWNPGEFLLCTLQSGSPRAWRQDCYSLAISGTSLGEPDLRPQFVSLQAGDDTGTFLQVQGDKIIRRTWGNPDSVIASVLDWFNKRLGTNWSVTNSRPTRVDIYDRQSGEALYTYSTPYWSIPCISPDGRRGAEHLQFKGLIMWDLDPRPRWPWALPLALLPSTLWITYRRYRRRRQLTHAPAVS